MASREFLKILSSARLGDVSAQQKLASAYLTGAFKTPIQPTNALIWLEKSYYSVINQGLIEKSVGSAEVSNVLAQVATINLAETFNSPAFEFGWNSFWNLAETQNQSESHFSAKWQLVHLLVDPANQEIQMQLVDWLKKKAPTSTLEKVSSLDLAGIQKIAKQYLQELAESSTTYATNAKELLIKLQPKNEALSSLWKVWLDEKNEDALIQAAELGLTIARLTLGLRLAQLDGKIDSEENKSNASLKKAAYWLELAAKDGDRDAWYALG